MSDYKSFAELEAAARKSVEGMKARKGFLEGLMKQIIDPYTDKGHFIYELLQNAEDMNATTVRFHLEKDCLYFDHNGTKRDFNLDDIDAITNVAWNENKQNDEDVIGKFGIGFKAVFLYTETPIIHSGEYHFKIIDKLIPTMEGVEEKPVIENGSKWTKFELPFNGNQKTPEECYQEIEEALLRLNYESLLFLRNINRIEITSLDKNRVIAKKEDDFSLYGKIINIDIEGGESFGSWIRFTKAFEYEEKGNIKKLPISIAYQFERGKDNELEYIISKDPRKVYIFFPAENEDSHFRFFINGPFITSSARNALKTDDPININILKEVGQLCVDSFEQLKDKGYLNSSFLYLMPNSSDNVPEKYKDVYNIIQEAFKTKELVPAFENDAFVRGEEAARGNRKIMEVLSDEDMIELNLYKNLYRIASNKYSYDYLTRTYGIPSSYWRGPENTERRWVPGFRDSDPIMKFYDDIGVVDVQAGFHDAWNLPIENIKDWIKKQPKRKLADLYLMFADLIKGREAFPNQPILVDKNNEAFGPNEIVWTKDARKVGNSISHIFDLYFIVPNGEVTEKECEKIFEYITESLGVQEQSDLEEIKSIISDLNESHIFDESYIQKLDMVILFYDELVNKNGADKVNPIYSELLFLADDNQFHHQEDILIGESYGNSDNQIIHDCLKRINQQSYVLSNQYIECGRLDTELFKSMINGLSFKDALSISKQMYTWSHPLFETKLKTGGRETSGKTFSDYEICYLNQLLQLEYVAFDAILFKRLNDIPEELRKRYTLARYAPNASSGIKECESTLVYYLKNNKWVLGDDGKLHKPSEIFIQNINESLGVDEDNVFWKALQFGSDLDEESQKDREAEERLTAKGKHIVSDEDYEELQKIKAKREKANSRRKTYSEAIQEESDPTYVEDEHDDMEDDTYGGVSDPERRESKIDEELEQDESEKTESRKTTATLRKTSKEERTALVNWYGGKCQICGTIIKKKNGEPYFEATDIVPMGKLKEEYDQHNGLCWNSLCLCPNCSAKYQVSPKNINAIANICDTEFDFTDDEMHPLEIELAGEHVTIKFTSKHLQAIQVAQKKFKK